MTTRRVFNLFCFMFISSLIDVDGKCVDNDGTVVQLPHGKIRGHVLKSDKGDNYYAFQEIPYAAPPIGTNRFQLPKEPNSWTGILNTTKNTKICYQSSKKYADLKITEDCLYLNVYRPQISKKNHLLPVLFWIHGGGFQAESGTFQYYGPKYLIDHGIVVVTINYRLGPFGSTGTYDGVIPLNLGLKDQRFALEWVNKNIHLFGGNPDKVTIAGESAGSGSVCLHLVGPWIGGKQLFHGAIMQSGTTVGFLPEPNPTESAFELGRALDPSFSSTDTRELLKVLQKAEAQDILKNGKRAMPAIENDGPFSYGGFPAFLDGNYKRIPVIIGYTSEEMVYVAEEKNITALKELDDNPSLLVNEVVKMSLENRKIVGKLFKQIYTHNTSFVEDFGAYIRHTTDQFTVLATIKQVEIMSTHVPAYLYQFSYKGPLGGEMEILKYVPHDAEKVGHTEDLHYIWSDANNTDVSKFPLDDQLALHRVVKLWANFVKYLNPTPEEDPSLNNIKWLPFEQSKYNYLNINNTLQMRQHPRQYRQINELLVKYMEPPFEAYS